MDEQVMSAMQKWPDVPAVYGWLSLNAQGDWLLHANGGSRECQGGEKIANEQIRHFMNRNYAATERGEWFFQNGPQRVYVDLACAPFIVRLADDMRSLVTHSGLPVTHINQWLLNEQGQVYLQTEHGAAMLAGRDMALVTPRLVVMQQRDILSEGGGATTGTPLDQPHLEALAAGRALQVSLDGAAGFTATLRQVNDRDLPELLNFVRVPLAA